MDNFEFILYQFEIIPVNAHKHFEELFSVWIEHRQLILIINAF